nr:MAG TPA: hypothetical protein [Bacteriophage sp.]
MIYVQQNVFLFQIYILELDRIQKSGKKIRKIIFIIGLFL